MPVGLLSQNGVDSGNNHDSAIHLTNIYSVFNLATLCAQHNFQALEEYFVMFIFHLFSGTIFFLPSQFPLIPIISHQSQTTESVAEMTFLPLKATGVWLPLCGPGTFVLTPRHGEQSRKPWKFSSFCPAFPQCCSGQAQCQRRERQTACPSGAPSLGRGGSHTSDKGGSWAVLQRWLWAVVVDWEKPAKSLILFPAVPAGDACLVRWGGSHIHKLCDAGQLTLPLWASLPHL